MVAFEHIPSRKGVCVRMDRHQQRRGDGLSVTSPRLYPSQRRHLGANKLTMPQISLLRGDTDWAALSARGIPTLNYFIGGLNFHSPFEFLPMPSFLLGYQLTARVCELPVG